MKTKERKIYCDKDKENDVTNTNLENTKTKHKMKTKENKNTGTDFGGGGTPEGTNPQNYTKRNVKKLPNIKSVEKSVLRYIIGQDAQVRQILTAIYKAIEFKSIKSNVLIVGNSGTGKTETIKQIAKFLNLPYTIEDATKYTEEGYYGDDVEEMIYNLIENAKGDLKKAQNGILIIDEIDKKAGGNYQGAERDVSGAQVLKSLLKIIEGTRMKITNTQTLEQTDFDTKNIIVIFLGAFSRLEKVRNKRLNVNPLGFNQSKPVKSSEQGYLKKDLIEYGFPEEFCGRIDTIIEMNKLTKNDLSEILKKSRLSIFERYKKELKKQGILLSYDARIFEQISEQALSVDTGARELSNIVNKMFENIVYDILADPGKYKKCTLELDIVHDNKKYKLE